MPISLEPKRPLLMHSLLMLVFAAIAIGLYCILPDVHPSKASLTSLKTTATQAPSAPGSAAIVPAPVPVSVAAPEPLATGKAERMIGIKHSLLLAIFLSFLIGTVFEVLCIVIALVTKWRDGAKGDVIMLTSFTRVIAIIAVLLVIIGVTGKLTAFSTAVGAFAGLLLGWSLQAPVSGFAAWVLISIKRPFRIGDRVQFPNLALVGDVIEVGFMYTKLNQVGGSIGSEDAIGRHILIPNAMLFSQVAINYTPVSLKGSTYILDEVVIRLTYDSNWDEAERILISAARKVTSTLIQATGIEPYIRADNWDYGVFMRLRFMTLATDRPRISHQILREIFKQVQNNNLVDFAIPYIYSYRKGMEGASAGRPATPDRPPAETEIAIDNIDDPEFGAKLTPEVEARVKHLAERISKMGLLQPIVVERLPNGHCRLLAGHLRYTACRRLGWKMIPAIVRESFDNEPAFPGKMA